MNESNKYKAIEEMSRVFRSVQVEMKKLAAWSRGYDDGQKIAKAKLQYDAMKRLETILDDPTSDYLRPVYMQVPIDINGVKCVGGPVYFGSDDGTQEHTVWKASDGTIRISTRRVETTQ